MRLSDAQKMYEADHNAIHIADIGSHKAVVPLDAIDIVGAVEFGNHTNSGTLPIDTRTNQWLAIGIAHHTPNILCREGGKTTQECNNKN